MSEWDRARRILAVRLDGAGDVIMTTPALRALKEGGPEGTELTLLTSPAGVAVARLVPEVDVVIAYEAPWMKGSARARGVDHLAMVETLAERHFDAAVVFTVYSQNPLPAAQTCLLADIPLRLAHCRENPYDLLTDWGRETEPEQHVRHEVQRQLDLVATVGRRTADAHLGLRVPDEARARVEAILTTHRLDAGRPWAVLHVGATAPSRRYPAQQYAEVARTLATDLGWQLFLTGSEEERALIEGIQAASGVPSVSLAGQLWFDELVALIEAAPVLITNNTAPAHIAAATGTPVVDLYALTNPQHTPWMASSRVLFRDVPCRNCYKSVCPQGHQKCLADVTPIEVVDAAQAMMSGRV